jgi:hypothetical protein
MVDFMCISMDLEKFLKKNWKNNLLKILFERFSDKMKFVESLNIKDFGNMQN